MSDLRAHISSNKTPLEEEARVPSQVSCSYSKSRLRQPTPQIDTTAVTTPSSRPIQICLYLLNSGDRVLSIYLYRAGYQWVKSYGTVFHHSNSADSPFSSYIHCHLHRIVCPSSSRILSSPHSLCPCVLNSHVRPLSLGGIGSHCPFFYFCFTRSRTFRLTTNMRHRDCNNHCFTLPRSLWASTIARLPPAIYDDCDCKIHHYRSD